MKKTLSLLWLILWGLFPELAVSNPYYTSSEIEQLNNESVSKPEFKKFISGFASRGQFKNTYKQARIYLYTDIFIQKNHKGSLFIKDLYCEKVITRNVSTSNLPRGSKTNIEHTWPQSKFNSHIDKELQKADLHHLFIVNSKANHLRGKQNFGEVDFFYQRTGRCDNSGLGILKKTPATVAWSSNDYYQPPLSHRGNIARALFYFAVRYELKINDTQEYFLRKWHEEDPVEKIDSLRNDRIMSLQGNRNPFIDFPKLVHSIKNF
jgi:hypothetical protein